MAKVLTIDDEWIHNELNVVLLKKVGITDVIALNSALEGLEYLEECKLENTFPDIIFVDLNMPEINGFMFLEQYEEKFSGYHPRIIVLTSSILESDQEEALKYHSVLEYWDKPLTRNKLKELFQKTGLLETSGQG